LTKSMNDNKKGLKSIVQVEFPTLHVHVVASLAAVLQRTRKRILRHDTAGILRPVAMLLLGKYTQYLFALYFAYLRLAI